MALFAFRIPFTTKDTKSTKGSADVLVLDRLRVLKAERDVIQFQIVRQAPFIHGLEQARPQFLVNLDRTADRPAR